MTAAELNPELRKLIDVRLEAIDRILASAEVAWSERRSIVGEVETQIFELLGRRGPVPTREDLLAVLAVLDPPECYLPEELRGRVEEPFTMPRKNWRKLPADTLKFAGKLVPGALGIAALVVVNGVVVVMMVASEGVIPWIIAIGALAWVNYRGVQWYLAWSSAHHGGMLDELRQSLANWLLAGRNAAA